MARSAAKPSGCSLRQPRRPQWPPRKATQNCPTRLRARSSSAARAGGPAIGGGGGGDGAASKVAGGGAAPPALLAR
eukprot:6112939-Alexandrium_andersonii.AAC.1